MELLRSRVNLSCEYSWQNVGKMSTIMRGKRQLQFYVVQFNQSGNVLPSKRPRFGSNWLDKRDGKGKENTIAATLCHRSHATHLQVQPQIYRFIAPRPAASHISIQQSTLPCQHLRKTSGESKTSWNTTEKIVRVSNYIQQADRRLDWTSANIYFVQSISLTSWLPNAWRPNLYYFTCSTAYLWHDLPFPFLQKKAKKVSLQHFTNPRNKTLDTSLSNSLATLDSK